MNRGDEVIRWCRRIAQYSESPSNITRTFLSPPMKHVHAALREWMEGAGCIVSVDSTGNLRCLYEGTRPGTAWIVMGSHLDTVPDAGAFDGVLGVVLACALVDSLGGRRLPFDIEVAGFSEEEGVRFRTPFLGSRGYIGGLDAATLAMRDAHGITVGDAIRAFGLDPSAPSARPRITAYFEFHIEQGPVLENLNLGLGVVEAIAGQTRLEITFRGVANHAGATPMDLRKDALAAAAEWIGAVEREALCTAGLVATVGRLDVEPGAGNVIPGSAKASLDVRHAHDSERSLSVSRLLDCARQISARRGVAVEWNMLLEQPATPMDSALTQTIERALRATGNSVHRMVSGAGHDAQIVAEVAPVAMLFIRSPKGLSHHPDEAVLARDVEAAFAAGIELLRQLEAQHA